MHGEWAFYFHLNRAERNQMSMCFLLLLYTRYEDIYQMLISYIKLDYWSLVATPFLCHCMSLVRLAFQASAHSRVSLLCYKAFTLRQLAIEVSLEAVLSANYLQPVVYDSWIIIKPIWISCAHNYCNKGPICKWYWHSLLDPVRHLLKVICILV